MNQEKKLPDAPAPQLPNLPMSPDDPFYPDPELQLPVTPSTEEPDSIPCPPLPAPAGQPKPVSQAEPE